jgi:hypothetical protein
MKKISMSCRPFLPGLFELATLAGEPRVHPNGFIQLDLDHRHRLHVWHPRLGIRQKTYSPIHNHIFSFESFVFSGRLVNVNYRFEYRDTPNDTHKRWVVKSVGEGESTILEEGDGHAVQLVPSSVDVVQPGQSYGIVSEAFHETLASEPTMTIMRKEISFVGAKKGANCIGAAVMVPVGQKPDNEFRRDEVNTDILWAFIAEAHPS